MTPPRPRSQPAGPVVVLPPARPGGPPRRFALAPGRVFFFLVVVFVLGAGAGAGALFPWLDGRRAAAESQRDEARRAWEELQVRFEELEAKTAEGVGTAAAGAIAPEAPSQPASPPMRISPPTDAETALRIAVARSKEPVTLLGEGLIVVQSERKAIPIPGGSLLAKVSKGGVWLEGVGTLPSGVRLENRLGPIEVNGRSYPGALELHVEDDGLLLINELELEKYLLGVVGAEVPGSWPIEAKKAQAVVARTYALMQRAQAEGPYHLEATIDDQVYAGTAVDATTKAAVTSTFGEVLLQDGLLVSAWFSSTCGGRSEDPAEVWPERPSHGNAVVTCTHCADSPYAEWTVQLPPDEIARSLRKAGWSDVNQVNGLHIRERTVSDRVRKLEIDTDAGPVTLSGQDFRRVMGYMKVKGAAFSVKVDGGSFRIEGGGFGHGVGMCQHGALGMANDGSGYREILTTYFPSAHVAKIY